MDDRGPICPREFRHPFEGRRATFGVLPPHLDELAISWLAPAELGISGTWNFVRLEATPSHQPHRDFPLPVHLEGDRLQLVELLLAEPAPNFSPGVVDPDHAERQYLSYIQGGESAAEVTLSGQNRRNICG